MNRKVVALILTLTMLLALVGLMSACSSVGEIPVTAVVVEDTEIFLSTSDVSNTARIKPSVYPAEATNQKVVFSYPVQNYISGTSTGEITALRETEKGKPIEIRVSAAENDKIYATVYVTVENVEAEEVELAVPSGIREVGVEHFYLGVESFNIIPSFIPSHASVGIDLNYTTTNESVATVNADGLVTIVGVGTAHIEAITFSGAVGYLKIVVKHTPPMYVMRVADSDVENFNQEPGVPKPINFTLIPLGEHSDPSPKIVWSDGRKTLDATANNGLMCTYLPEENVTPGNYTITVTITDRDDQVLVLKSDVIKIYSSLLIEGMTFVNTGSYTIGYGDRITRTVEIAEGQRPPDGYDWYYYAWDAAKEPDYTGDGSATDVYNYIITNKQKPTRNADGDYTLFGSSTSNGDEQSFAGNLYADGTVYVFALPTVSGEKRYDLFCGDSTPYTVEASGKTEIHNLHTTYGYVGSAFMPKLAWTMLGSDREYVVEIATLDDNGIETGTKYYYSDDAAHADYFVASTFILPTEYGQHQQFRARVKVQDNGTTWSEYVTYTGVGRSANLEPYYANILGDDIGYGRPNLGIDLYMYDMRELGNFLNALRVLRPTVSHVAGSGAYLKSEQSTEASYSHRYDIGMALTFISNTHQSGLSNGGLYETRKIIYTDGRPEDTNYSEVLLLSKSSTDEMSKMSQTLSLAFASYCESGTAQFVVTNTVYSLTDNVYYVNFSYYVNADDATITHVTTSANKIVKKKTTAGEVVLTHTTPTASKIEYFSGNDRGVLVTTSDQLYEAAQLGLKPIPAEGSAAAAVYQEIVAVMDSIVSSDMTDRERIIAIYEWLTQNVYYDYYAAESTSILRSDAAFRMEGVFGIGTVDSLRLALCDGYAKAFVMMSWMVGVPALKISGNAGGTGHAWNAVFVGGEWSLVDATWGATQSVRVNGEDVDIATHKYLFRSEEFMIAEDHRAFGSYPATDMATYGEYAFYEMVGALGKLPDASDILDYLIGKDGVLLALDAGEIMSVDVVLTTSAFASAETPLNTYLVTLANGLQGMGYSIPSGDYFTLTPGGYGEGDAKAYVIKIYIAKI